MKRKDFWLGFATVHYSGWFFSSSGKVIALGSQMLELTQQNSLGDVCPSACRKILKAED